MKTELYFGSSITSILWNRFIISSTIFSIAVPPGSAKQREYQIRRRVPCIGSVNDQVIRVSIAPVSVTRHIPHEDLVSSFNLLISDFTIKVGGSPHIRYGFANEWFTTILR